MTTETILTGDQIARMRRDEFGVWRAEDHEDIERFACAIEQAVLQSEQVQAWKRDAELFQFLLEEAWFQRAFDRFDPNDNGDQSKFESECRRILSAAMEGTQ